jgi:molybdate transport system ATP-binding protein
MINAQLRLQRGDFQLDVTLALAASGITALWGPSGCGKTTVLRALAGLDRAAGRVAINDEVWQDDAAGRFVPAHQRAIGYVIQEPTLFPHLNVMDNLRYGQRRANKNSSAHDLEPAVELLGIAGLLHRRPTTLSGGERQRVAIARALASQPRLLLMDEPLAALDAARKADILPYLERLHRQLSLPMIYVSHAIDEVTRLADHVVLMDQGRVLNSGALDEVFSNVNDPMADDVGAAPRTRRWRRCTCVCAICGAQPVCQGHASQP